MSNLNPQQLAASKPDSGINLVIAGAGTGKTSTMITKIQNIIEHSIVRPDEILILTFSKKAAGEIKERLSQKLKIDCEPGFAGTFHSFSLKLLKDHKDEYLKHRMIKSFPAVIGKDEKESIMKEMIMEKPEKFLGLPVNTVIKLAENIDHLDTKILQKLKSGPLFYEITNTIKRFENYKKDKLLIEFEDMINHIIELLESYPHVRNKVTSKYRYIFVDEFQDTSENNFRLLSLLLPKSNRNLFMVGDDFQSIYKFRHSRVEYIINAEIFFPGISIHKLTINYRSHKEIITISNRFINLNKFRTSKKITSHHGKGGKVRVHNIEDMENEAEVLIQIISKVPDNYTIAILYRNNYQGTFLKNKIEVVNSVRVIEFMTMHGSKGLEFDTVIIAGISDKIIPDRTSDLEEERRLFYVALTRAKKELHLLYYKNGPDELPRFIREIGYKKI
jgi:DNA helicase-2/ATP-dependent DNA helicase PcrA